MNSINNQSTNSEVKSSKKAGLIILVSTIVLFVGLYIYVFIPYTQSFDTMMKSPKIAISSEKPATIEMMNAVIDSLFKRNSRALLYLYEQYSDSHYEKFGSKVNEKIFQTLIDNTSNTDLLPMLLHQNIKKHWKAYKDNRNISEEKVPSKLKNDILIWAKGNKISTLEPILSNIKYISPDLHSEVSEFINSTKQAAREKFNIVERSYYPNGINSINFRTLSDIERFVYGSEFRDKLRNVYFRPTKSSKLKTYRGKYRFAKNPKLASDMYHYLNNYYYYNYPQDEFKKRKIKSEHDRLLQTKDQDNQLQDSYYVLFSIDNPIGIERKPTEFVNEFNFNHKVFSLIVNKLNEAVFTEGKSFVLANSQFDDKSYNNINGIAMLFDNTPAELHIKMENESQAERFKNKPYFFRLNFLMTKAHKPYGRPNYSTIYGESGLNSTKIYHFFSVYGKILSLELHSDVLGTLVWIPDD